MKAEDLRPCDACHKRLCSGNDISFYVVTIDQAVVNPEKVRQFQGAAMMMGSVKLAEVMSPYADEMVTTVCEHSGNPPEKLLICFTCYTRRSLAEIIESANAAETRREHAPST